MAICSLSSAQTVDVSALEQCSALEDETQKLACFEAIVAESQDTAEATKTAEDAGDAVLAGAPDEAVSGPVMVAPAPGTESEINPRAAQASESMAPGMGAKDDAETAGTTSPTERQPPAADDTFGQDHLRRPTEQDEPENVLRATVVEVSKGRFGVLRFHLDNGQIWQQLEPRYYPYPKNREFDAEISTGMMGEYSLQVDGKGRKVIVRRTR